MCIGHHPKRGARSISRRVVVVVVVFVVAIAVSSGAGK